MYHTVEEENQARVLATLRMAFNSIRTNIPGISENMTIENLINHGREMVEGGWLRSNRDGAWFLTRRGVNIDPRVRMREEDEHQARLRRAPPAREIPRNEGNMAGYVDEALNQIIGGLANNRRLLEDQGER